MSRPSFFISVWRYPFSVSYTHLFADDPTIVFCKLKQFHHRITADTVSYTHLDVYKRQHTHTQYGNVSDDITFSLLNLSFSTRKKYFFPAPYLRCEQSEQQVYYISTSVLIRFLCCLLHIISDISVTPLLSIRSLLFHST